jgi:hypothetical protein
MKVVEIIERIYKVRDEQMNWERVRRGGESESGIKEGERERRADIPTLKGSNLNTKKHKYNELRTWRGQTSIQKTIIQWITTLKGSNIHTKTMN